MSALNLVRPSISAIYTISISKFHLRTIKNNIIALRSTFFFLPLGKTHGEPCVKVSRSFVISKEPAKFNPHLTLLKLKNHDDFKEA